MPSYIKSGGSYWAAAFLLKSLDSLRRLRKQRINSHFRSAPGSREPTVHAQLTPKHDKKKTPFRCSFLSWWGLINQVLLAYKEDIKEKLQRCIYDN